MKAEQMRAKSADELKDLVMELRQEQMKLRFQKSGQQLTNTSQLRVLRQDIARAKTLMNEQTKGVSKKAPKTAKPAPAGTDAKSSEKKTAKAPAAKKAAKAKA